MSYVIWNLTKRMWVANPGRKSSFTNRLQHARTFPTRSAAESDCCGNEVVRER